MNLEIIFGKDADYTLQFEVLNTPIAQRWVERMQCRNDYALDDPQRFYQFSSVEHETTVALNKINKTIDTINSHKPIVSKHLEDIHDQDTLNYLHHVFEIYHGGLDQQNHEFWTSAPKKVRKALADLNIDVHRCEGLAKSKTAELQHPRFVCTWFGLPKTETLPIHIQHNYGEKGYCFGGVYLKYTEIGKPCLDLAKDNDNYIADEMFKPFTHISADFDARFYTNSSEEIVEKFSLAKQYYELHKKYFRRFEIQTSDDARILPFVFRVAQLVYEPGTEQTIIDTIAKKQYVHTVRLI